MKQQNTLWTVSLMILTLTACSTPPTASETTKAVFEELEGTLPTASRADTPKTKREVAVHRVVFFELCDKLDAGCAG